MTYIGPTGFTTFTQSSLDQIYYVDSTRPSDTGTGLTPATAKKTVAAGVALMRNGFADWLLLKQGGSWLNDAFVNLAFNGRSADQPAVIGSWNSVNPNVVNPPSTGAGRPLIQTQSSINGLSYLSGSFGSNVAVVGIEFYSYDRDPNSSAYATANSCNTNTAIAVGVNTNWSLIEDCRVTYYGGAIALAAGVGGCIQQAYIRRNILTLNYGAISVYCDAFNYLNFYQNVWDRSAYSSQIGGVCGLYSDATLLFSHGLYINGFANNQQAPTDFANGPVDFIENIYSRDVTGPHLRAGGHFDNNLWVGNKSNGDFGRYFLGHNNYYINNVVAENVDEPNDYLTITSASTASPSLFTYSSAAFGGSSVPGTPPNGVGQLVRFVANTNSLPPPLTSTMACTIQNWSSGGPQTFTLNNYFTGAAISLTVPCTGGITMFDVGTATCGQCMNLFSSYNGGGPITLDFDVGPFLAKNNIYCHYAGSMNNDPFVLSVDAGSVSSQSFTNNVSYLWSHVSSGAQTVPGRPPTGINLMKTNQNSVVTSGNIQDTGGTGIDDNTGLSITQYTLANANAATMANYAISVGTSNSLDGFMAACTTRLPGVWTYSLSAPAVCDWYRQKFGMTRYFPIVAGFPAW